MNTREISTSPGTTTLYARALLGSIVGKQGNTLPVLKRVQRHIRIDPAHLAAYNRVCGFVQRDTLPGTYPFVLAFAQQMDIITDPAFPFPAMGLVHLQNCIHHMRPIHVAERLTLTVKPANLRAHAKGLAFDMLITVSTDDGEVVWEAVSTSLRRQETASGRTTISSGSTKSPAPATHCEPWVVPANTGRLYASASGDRNPIHLYALTARLFGFPRAVAHGMWLKARCLAALDNRLPSAYSVDVAFKTPVLMPASVVFQTDSQENRATGFSLRDARSTKPHLAGTLTPHATEARSNFSHQSNPALHDAQHGSWI